MAAVATPWQSCQCNNSSNNSSWHPHRIWLTHRHSSSSSSNRPNPSICSAPSTRGSAILCAAPTRYDPLQHQTFFANFVLFSFFLAIRFDFFILNFDFCFRGPRFCSIHSSQLKPRLIPSLPSSLPPSLPPSFPYLSGHAPSGVGRPPNRDASLRRALGGFLALLLRSECARRETLVSGARSQLDVFVLLFCILLVIINLKPCAIISIIHWWRRSPS